MANRQKQPVRVETIVTYEKAKDILEKINSTSFTVLKDAVIAAAIRYARIRTDWRLKSIEERKEANTARTFAHNALIDSCNILSRNMLKAGEDIQWRKMLGDDRKEIGDFACFLHCILGVQAR